MSGRYDRRLDAICAAVVLVPATIVVRMLAASAAYFWMMRRYLDSVHLWGFLAREGLSAFFVAEAVRMRVRLRCGTVDKPQYVRFAAASALAIVASSMWFVWPMHDIGLLFGSHGRWGCSTITAGGWPAYLLCDVTVPWLLFVPMMLIVAGHAFATRTAR
jgi:hypothetical protein